MARLDAVKGDAGIPGEIFTRLCDGERLREIGKSMRLPVGRFVEWYTTEHVELYDAALKVRAADLALDALDEAGAATADDVAVRKLRADVALKLAAKFDRDRYGERAASGSAVVPLSDAGLLISCGRLLEMASRGELRLEREVRADTPIQPSQAMTLPVKEI